MSEPDTGTIEQLKTQITEMLGRATELGASQAEAAASFGTGLSVTVRLGEVETVEHHRDQGLGITVYFGKRKGSASTSDLRPAALEETVRKACSLARFAAEDACAGLADPDRLAGEIPDLDLCYPWPLEPEVAIRLAAECEAAAMAVDPRIDNSEGATVSTGQGCRAYGNTHGFLAAYPDSQHSLSCAVLASEAGRMERDFEYTTARDPVDLETAAKVGREAGLRTVRRLGAVKLGTRSVPVLFPARVARGLFGHLLGAISGGSLYRRASFLVDSLGSRVFAEHLSIEERPHLRKGLASAPFDDEGVATTDRNLVSGGILQGYLLGSYYARKLGMQSTGNAGGAHNLLVSSTGQSFEGLLSQLHTGLLVSELIGHGVNTVTGDYSRGAAGFWVEGGEIRYPVSEVTVAGNLRDMYRAIAAVGSDVDRRGAIQTGSVLVESMTVAGN